MKDKVSKNTLLEAHKMAIPDDGDEKEAISKKMESNLMNFKHAASPVKSGRTDGGDVYMLFIKLCQDERYLPIFDLIHQASGLDPNKSIFFTNRPLNDQWCSILSEVLKKEKDFKFMVRKIFLVDNRMSDYGFARILQGLY